MYLCVCMYVCMFHLSIYLYIYLSSIYHLLICQELLTCCKKLAHELWSLACSKSAEPMSQFKFEGQKLL